MTGEMRHLLQSGMDIFYLRKKKKRCESIYRGVPSYCFFVFYLSKLLILLLKRCFCVAVIFPGTLLTVN